MSNRCLQNPVVMAAFEGTYGTINKTITVKLADTLEYNDIVSEVAVDRKSGNITMQRLETTTGYKYVDVTLSGALTKAAMDMLLQALTNDSTSPFVHANSCTRQGLSLYRYTDIGTLETTTDDVYDVITGCILTQVALNLNPGGVVTYSATFKGEDLSHETVNTGDDALTLAAVTDASHPNDALCNFGDIVVSLLGAEALTKFNGGTITFTNELVGDDILYQNSETIQNPLIQNAGGSLQISWLYDAAVDTTAYSNIQGTLQTDTVSIVVDGVGTYAIVMYGKIESYENPSAGRGMMIGSLTKKLMGDAINSQAMLTITYTAV